MTTRSPAEEAARTPRDLAMLAAEIRQAYLAVSAAIPLDNHGDPGDPYVANQLQARDQAFGWALAELIDGGYAAPAWMTASLAGGIIPELVPETEDLP